jgi:hypothetical protein
MQLFQTVVWGMGGIFLLLASASYPDKPDIKWATRLLGIALCVAAGIAGAHIQI